MWNRLARPGFWLVLCAGTGLAGDLSRAAGALERLSDASLSLRLADGVVIDAQAPATGDLSGQALAKQFGFGDQVEMTFRPLDAPVMDAHEGRYQRLEVTGARLLRRALPEEAERLAASHPFGFSGNLLPGAPAWVLMKPPPEAGDDLEKARAVNLAAIFEMPNFIADEIVKSYGGEPEKLQSTIQSEITVRAGGEFRRSVLKDGQAASWQNLPEYYSYGGFAGVSRLLFDAHCPNQFDAAGRRELSGIPVRAYRFRAPADGCFSIRNGYQTYRPAVSGLILIRETDGQLVNFEYTAEGFPPEFPLSAWKWKTSWGDVTIGEESHLLPVASELVTVSAGAATRLARVYRNHRHFEASSRIDFP